MSDADQASPAKPRVIRLRRPEAKPAESVSSPGGSIYLDRPWQSILAAWPEELRVRQAEGAKGLVEGGWNAGAAAYLAYEKIANELFEARVERLSAKGRTK